MLAVDSPIDELADELFWVHMVQHVLLIAVAPPLLALARPWNRMWHGIPIEYRRAARSSAARVWHRCVESPGCAAGRWPPG
jgi:cytochrome c oxidase assembly factor CtaG